MFKKKQTAPDPLKEELDRVLDELSGLSSTTKEYAKAVKQYGELSKIYASSQKKTPKISNDALLGAGSHLLGLGMILGFEKFNVITSKALGFVMKPTLKSGSITK